MAEDKEKNADVGSDEPENNPEPDGEGENKKGQYDEAFVKSLQTESILRKKKITELEKKLKTFEDEKLTEAEKDKKKIKELEEERDRLKAEQKDKSTDNLILTVANGKNFADMEVVKMLVKKELEAEEEITKESVEKVVEKLAKDKPFLVSSSTNVNPSSGNFAKNNNEPAKDANKLMSDFLHGE
jgi:alanyl-tRNA synthetase